MQVIRLPMIRKIREFELENPTLIKQKMICHKCSKVKTQEKTLLHYLFRKFMKTRWRDSRPHIETHSYNVASSLCPFQAPACARPVSPVMMRPALCSRPLLVAPVIRE